MTTMLTMLVMVWVIGVVFFASVMLRHARVTAYSLTIKDGIQIVSISVFWPFVIAFILCCYSLDKL